MTKFKRQIQKDRANDTVYTVTIVVLSAVLVISLVLYAAIIFSVY